MSFCTECGTRLPEGAMFCPNCGTTLGEAEASPKNEGAAEPVQGDANGAIPAQDEANVFVHTNQAAPAFEASQTAAPGAYDPASGFSAREELGYPPAGQQNGGKKKISGAAVAIIVILSAMVLVVVAVVLFFQALNKDDGKGSPEDYGTPSLINPSAGTNVAGSGDLSDGIYHVSIIGAEGLYDEEGTPVMRVYYEFTNNFTYPLSAWDALDFSASQDGYELGAAYIWAEDDVYYNYSRNIRPGISIQCSYEFEYDEHGGSVDFSIFSWADGPDAGTVTATYDPNDLPGPPPKYVIKPVPDPVWTLAINSEGLLDEEYYVSVLDAQLLDDADGDPAIRVYYDFTNNSGDYASLYDALYIHTYQDGIELGETYLQEYSETDDNIVTEIAPGETIRVSAVFKLRNETSAVEAEVEAFTSYDAVGQTYNIR